MSTELDGAVPVAGRADASPTGRARGQHAGLTRSAILAAAVELVDEQGLAALSMRRLGSELGVEAMALYHHVGSKDALLDGLVEQLFLTSLPEPIEGEPWREALHRHARGILDTLLAHPNLVPVVLSRPAVTPGALSTLERAVAVARTSGMPSGRALDLVYALIGFVVGHVAMGGDAGETSTARLRLLAGLDLSGLPGLSDAVHSAGGTVRRTSTFDTTLDAILAGFDTSTEDA